MKIKKFREEKGQTINGSNGETHMNESWWKNLEMDAHIRIRYKKSI